MVVLQADLTPLERWALHQYNEMLHVARRTLIDPSRSTKFLWKTAWVYLRKAEDDLEQRLGSMAVKKHSNKEFQFERWINQRLEEPHKEELELLAQNVDFNQLSGWLTAMAYEGYSFSCAWDDYSDALQVSLVCKAPDDPNYGLGLSARHPDFDLAVLTLQYKHEQMLNAKWSDAPPTPKGNSWG